jgi:hypothetical protein
MSDPLWSVVIPTAERPHLLRAALRSVLCQTHDDFEIIVSDNSRNRCARSIVDEFGDGRIRYAATADRLLMHESWQFALGQARGQYITLLCDDDAIHPRTLERAQACMEEYRADVATWRSCSWNELDGGKGARLHFGPPFTDRVIDMDGPALLDAAFDLRVRYTDTVPKMLNTAVRRSVLDRIASAGARLFLPASPDYSAMLVLAAHADRMILLDAPLLIAGATAASIGASSTIGGEVAARFIQDLLSREPSLLLPHPPLTSHVWLAQTFMQCAREVPSLRGRTINLTRAYGLAALDIAQLERVGAPVAELKSQLNATLAGPLRAHAAAIVRFAPQDACHAEPHLRGAAGETQVLSVGAFMANDGDAEEEGLTTIDEFATSLDSWISRRSRCLEGFWDHVASRARGRVVVLYGLGRNALALLRYRPPCDDVTNGHLLTLDDNLESPVALPRMGSIDELSPDRHFVVLTPNKSNDIRRRLGERGMQCGRDWASLMSIDIAAQRQVSKHVSESGTGNPLGCTS